MATASVASLRRLFRSSKRSIHITGIRIVMGVVFPAEAHLSIGYVHQPMVGDCDTMSVPSQIVQDVVWTAEWSLGIHHPVLSLSLIHISEPTRLLSISYAVFCLKKKKH